MKTPDLGTVVRVILNCMQRARGPVHTPSPTTPGICDLVHVFVGRIRVSDSGKKIPRISRHKLPSDKASPSILDAQKRAEGDGNLTVLSTGPLGRNSPLLLTPSARITVSLDWASFPTSSVPCPGRLTLGTGHAYL